MCSRVDTRREGQGGGGGGGGKGTNIVCARVPVFFFRSTHLPF